MTLKCACFLPHITDCRFRAITATAFCADLVDVTQAVGAFESALEAIKVAGVELVKFDMGLLTAEGAEIEAELLLAYEMPRELSR